MYGPIAGHASSPAIAVVVTQTQAPDGDHNRENTTAADRP
jgi:hypothetical protein